MFSGERRRCSTVACVIVMEIYVYIVYGRYMYICRLPEYLCETLRRIVAEDISDKLR